MILLVHFNATCKCVCTFCKLHYNVKQLRFRQQILIVDSWVLSVSLLCLFVCYELWDARWLLLNPLVNSNFIVCLINKIRLVMLLKVATKVLAWTKRNREWKKGLDPMSMWNLKSKLKKSQKILSLSVKKKKKKPYELNKKIQETWIINLLWVDNVFKVYWVKWDCHPYQLQD